MDKLVYRRLVNSLPERLNVKSLYCLKGMWPIGISSFNKGPAEKKKTKKKEKEVNQSETDIGKLNTKIKLKNYIKADQKGINKESNNTKKINSVFSV